VGKKILDRPGTPQARFDLRGWPQRLPVGKQLIDIQSVAKIRRDAPRRGVRLPYVSLLLEASHDVPQGGG
jgi:hypothetical protein